MYREHFKHYSKYLDRDMNILVYGNRGVPMLAFPCQDGMADNWESFRMPEEISDYINGGMVRLYCVDSIDRETWSDVYGDNEHRAWMQEQYYNYIIEEVLPLIDSENKSGVLPVATGCSLGATHAAVLFFRRPELFSGILAFSGSYSALDFWNGWMNGLLYENSPLDFLKNMPEDHPYIELYNSKRIVLCVGQGMWEGTCLTTTREMRRVFEQKDIHGWTDIWGHDVEHDWPWWKKQIRYHLPDFLVQDEIY